MPATLPLPQQRRLDLTTRVWAPEGDFVVLDHTQTELPEGWVLVVVGAKRDRPRAAAIEPSGAIHRVPVPEES